MNFSFLINCIYFVCKNILPNNDTALQHYMKYVCISRLPVSKCIPGSEASFWLEMAGQLTVSVNFPRKMCSRYPLGGCVGHRVESGHRDGEKRSCYCWEVSPSDQFHTWSGSKPELSWRNSANSTSLLLAGYEYEDASISWLCLLLILDAKMLSSFLFSYFWNNKRPSCRVSW